MRHICLLVGSRANWGSSVAVAQALQGDARLTILCFASALSERYGDVAYDIEDQGFDVVRASSQVDGGDLENMVSTSAVTMHAVGQALSTMRPDIVYAVGDRYEVLPAVYAAALLNIPIAHQMGGELTGTIDEHVRHALTKLSHWHFVATEKAAERVITMGEHPDRVWCTGCPRIDVANRCDTSGDWRHTMLVSQHPVTTEVDYAMDQIERTLQAVKKSEWDGPVHLFWPNSDAGSEAMVQFLRRYRPNSWFTHRNLEPQEYMSAMASCSVIVGNSSSAIREGAFLGTPAVNVGSRQQLREHGRNVRSTKNCVATIARCIDQQVTHGRYESDPLYGTGDAGPRIADVLCNERLPRVQKVWAA